MTIFAYSLLALLLLDAGVCWYWRRDAVKRDRQHTGRDPKRRMPK